jgi:hypothetical protein
MALTQQAQACGDPVGHELRVIPQVLQAAQNRIDFYGAELAVHLDGQLLGYGHLVAGGQLGEVIADRKVYSVVGTGRLIARHIPLPAWRSCSHAGLAAAARMRGRR